MIRNILVVVEDGKQKPENAGKMPEKSQENSKSQLYCVRSCRNQQNSLRITKQIWTLFHIFTKLQYFRTRLTSTTGFFIVCLLLHDCNHYVNQIKSRDFGHDV